MGWKVSARVRAGLGLDQQLAVQALRYSAFELRGQALRISAAERPRLRARQNDGTRRGMGAGQIECQVQQLCQPPVGNRGALLGVEHAQSVRHVVEGGIEPPGEQAHVAAGDHRIEQHPAQAVGDELQRGEERHQHECENGVVGAADRNQRQGHRDAGADDLGRHQQIAGEVAAGDADHVGERQREAEDLHEGIGRLGEGQQAPDAHQRYVSCRADDIAQLPVPGLLHGNDVGATAGIGTHVERAHAGNHEHGHRAQIESLLAGLPGGDERRDGSRERADEQAAEV